MTTTENAGSRGRWAGGCPRGGRGLLGACGFPLGAQLCGLEEGGLWRPLQGARLSALHSASHSLPGSSPQRVRCRLLPLSGSQA